MCGRPSQASAAALAAAKLKTAGRSGRPATSRAKRDSDNQGAEPQASREPRRYRQLTVNLGHQDRAQRSCQERRRRLGWGQRHLHRLSSPAAQGVEALHRIFGGRVECCCLAVVLQRLG